MYMHSSNTRVYTPAEALGVVDLLAGTGLLFGFTFSPLVIFSISRCSLELSFFTDTWYPYAVCMFMFMCACNESHVIFSVFRICIYAYAYTCKKAYTYQLSNKLLSIRLLYPTFSFVLVDILGQDLVNSIKPQRLLLVLVYLLHIMRVCVCIYKYVCLRIFEYSLQKPHLCDQDWDQACPSACPVSA